MLCPRPISRVPYREAHTSKMQRKPELHWRCPCGTVVKVGRYLTVPSHRIPPRDPDRVSYQACSDKITELFDTLPASIQARLTSKLLNRVKVPEDKPMTKRRGTPRPVESQSSLDVQAILFNRDESD